jgi:hypothetical protein
MNEYEQSRRFAYKSTKAARETIERGVSATEEATKGAEQSFSSSLASMRELNIKLIDMVHANAAAIPKRLELLVKVRPKVLRELLGCSW